MLLIALALAQAAPFDTKADYVELARTHSLAEWPNDFQMQEYCLKQQAEGVLKFKAAHDTIGKSVSADASRAARFAAHMERGTRG